MLTRSSHVAIRIPQAREQKNAQGIKAANLNADQLGGDIH
jgi:hypothetical protein